MPWSACVGHKIELSDGRLLIKSPKTEAGKRSVSIPAAVLPDLEIHLTRYALPGPEGRVFTATGGTPLRRQNFRRVWVKALAAADLPPVHFHDLRHTGNTLAAAGGASLRELMARMGHASTRAAVIYQHASAQRDRAIAASLNEAIEAATSEPQSISSETENDRTRPDDTSPLGTQMARRARLGSKSPARKTSKTLADLRKHNRGDEGNRTPNPCLAKAVL